MGDLILPGPDNVSILGSAKRHFMPFSDLETFYDNLKATDLIFYVINENIKRSFLSFERITKVRGGGGGQSPFLPWLRL